MTTAGHCLFFQISRAAGWYEINFNLKLISTQNITSSPLTLCFVSLSPSAADSAMLAVVFHKATDDPVNTNPAADVGATAGTLVSLPKQLCHQRWVVSPAMMDDSDKFCHPRQPTQLLDSGVSQQG